jgi:putative tryptophan/tyrosine transport system substrate-binding protein
MMGRRVFITMVAGSILAAPLAAAAPQPGKVYHIGHVSLTSSEDMAPYLQAFEEGLRELGYLKGRDFIIESRSANGNAELMNEAAVELVRLNVDVILTGVNQGIVAARQATTTIPIVMVYAIDPIGAGFIKSLAHPGGNITGGTFEASPQIYGKQLEYLQQINPKLRRVAFLWNPAATAARAYWEATKDGARQLNLEVQSVEVRKLKDFDGGFAAISRRRAEAMIVVADPVTLLARTRIAQSAARHAVPVVASRTEFVEAGALLSYGPHPIERWRRAAVYVDKLLKGANAAELPVEQPSTFELVINLKVAKSLGLTIPQLLLLQADKVIQ